MERKTYKVICKISDGGFGEIYKVSSPSTNEILVLKHLKFRGNLNEQTYIKNEIYSLSSLRHENIISFREVVVKSEEVNIIMEYADGGNLEDFVSEHKTICNTLVVDIFIQILKAVEFCHQNSIAHRDITPSNVLILRNRTIKLADFGLSMKCMSTADQPLLCDDFLGNRLFSAPEVLRGIVHDAILADLWNLGVLLYFIMFTRTPFTGYDEEILIQQQTIGNTITTSHCIDLFQRTLLNFLKIIPCDRTCVSTVLHSWNNVTNASVLC
ncbi:NUAK family SNF1-like kinase 2 [Mytilus californianus]|uniref:NUAK family SNF1-like kinase 2 n=1 Tax=Mytilus californianus TaxID=6549 RepID=UPI0022458EBE|nr:NUAK family SNF1-like kinase 2 [Mytilus californianus]